MMQLFGPIITTMKSKNLHSRQIMTHHNSVRIMITTVLVLIGFVVLFAFNRLYVLDSLEIDPKASQIIDRHNHNTTLSSSSSSTNRNYFRSKSQRYSSNDESNAGGGNGSIPDVAWLMTYPNSGTTYTLKLIQQYTNTTTGTNYGIEQSSTKDSIPINDDWDMGPYWRYTTWNRPQRFILTKTHCGGNCMCAKPEEYVETQRSFEIACRSGNKIMMNASRFETTYDASIPKRAVHLFRNPFDNIVARLHLEQKKWSNRDEKEKLELYTSDREGFMKWCKNEDRRAKKAELSSRFLDYELSAIAMDLPCHAELIRYIWWHELAMDTVRRLELPFYNMYYENYTENFDSTVNELFDFLYLSPAEGAVPPEFITGKHYVDYYDKKHLLLAKKLAKMLASKDLWHLIGHYFD